jgi:hypothetical protein
VKLFLFACDPLKHLLDPPTLDLDCVQVALRLHTYLFFYFVVIALMALLVKTGYLIKEASVIVTIVRVAIKEGKDRNSSHFGPFVQSIDHHASQNQIRRLEYHLSYLFF